MKIKNAFVFLLPILIFLSCDSTQNKENQSISNNVTPPPVQYGKTADDLKMENDLKVAKMNQVKIGQPFPSGTLYSTDSTSISTDTYQGKLLFLDFWATWCALV